MNNRVGLLVVIVLSVSAIGIVSGVVSANDSLEPNDTIETAEPIDTGTYENLTLDGDESDYYALSVEKGEPVNATVTFRSASYPDNYPGVEIIDEQGNSVDTRSSYDTTPVSDTGSIDIAWESDKAQTVYVRVYGASDRGEVRSNYELAVTTKNDNFEPNGALEAAPSITSGTYENLTLDGDENDYYALSVEKGEPVNATATFRSASYPDNDPVVKIINEQGNSVDTERSYDTTPVSDTGSIDVAWESDKAQTVYVRVYGATDAGEVRSNYNLSVTGGSEVPDSSVPLSPSVVVDSQPITAGTQTDVTVIVEDGSGSAVAGATVEIPELGVSKTTDMNGEATLSVIPPDAGEYAVSASAEGYATATATLTVKAASTGEHESGVSEALFDAVDKNGDDVLSRDETRRMVKDFIRTGETDGIPIARDDVRSLVKYLIRQ